jgi:hypothetical protein
VLANACPNAILEVDKDTALNVSHLVEPTTMYTGSNWRLCRFDFSADNSRYYPEQCASQGDWMEPKVSPEELGHSRRLQALALFHDGSQDQPTPGAARVQP